MIHDVEAVIRLCNEKLKAVSLVWNENPANYGLSPLNLTFVDVAHNSLNIVSVICSFWKIGGEEVLAVLESRTVKGYCVLVLSLVNVEILARLRIASTLKFRNIVKGGVCELVGIAIVELKARDKSLLSSVVHKCPERLMLLLQRIFWEAFELFPGRRCEASIL